MLMTVVSFLLQYLVFSLMLSIGLSAEPRELREIVRRPRLYLRALLVMELGIPLFAIAVVSGLGVAPLGATLLLLVAICPGAPFIPSATKAKGATHSTVGLNLLVLVSLLAPLAIPVWVAILDRISPFELAITPAQVLARVVPTVLAPLVLGLVVRRVVPRVADVVGRAVHYFFLVAFAVAIVVVCYLGATVFLDIAPRTYLAAAIIVAGSALMGYWAAAGHRDEQRTTGVAAVLGNPGLALAIVAASYPGFKAGALIAVYLLVRKLALVPFELWMKRRARPAASPPSVDRLHPVAS